MRRVRRHDFWKLEGKNSFIFRSDLPAPQSDSKNFSIYLIFLRAGRALLHTHSNFVERKRKLHLAVASMRAAPLRLSHGATAPWRQLQRLMTHARTSEHGPISNSEDSVLTVLTDTRPAALQDGEPDQTESRQQHCVAISFRDGRSNDDIEFLPRFEFDKVVPV